MSRRAAPIPADRFGAVGSLEPAGAHTLEIEIPHVANPLRFTLDGVAQLKRTIEQFEREATVWDGGPDRLYPRRFYLEVR